MCLGVCADERAFIASAPDDDSSGSAAVVAVAMGGTLHVANAGDSRAVLCRSGVASPVSVDHKPEGEDEFNRIVARGGGARGGEYDEDFAGVATPARDQYPVLALPRRPRVQAGRPRRT